MNWGWPNFPTLSKMEEALVQGWGGEQIGVNQWKLSTRLQGWKRGLAIRPQCCHMTIAVFAAKLAVLLRNIIALCAAHVYSSPRANA